MKDCLVFLRDLLKEKRSLKSRLGKLNMFFATDDFKSLSCFYQKLLCSQFTAMQIYLGILDLRIKYLKGVFRNE